MFNKANNNHTDTNYTWQITGETDVDVTLSLSLEVSPEYSPVAILLYNKNTNEIIINDLLFNNVKYAFAETLEKAEEVAIDYIGLQISKKINCLKKIKAALSNKLI